MARGASAVHRLPFSRTLCMVGHLGQGSAHCKVSIYLHRTTEAQKRGHIDAPSRIRNQDRNVRRVEVITSHRLLAHCDWSIGHVRTKIECAEQCLI
jgi:hypothetical protein